MLLEHLAPERLDQVVGHPPLRVVVAVEPLLGEPDAAVAAREVAGAHQHAAHRGDPAGAGEEPAEPVEVEARSVELPEGAVERRLDGVEAHAPRDRQPARRERGRVLLEPEVVDEEVPTREGGGARAGAEIELPCDRRVERTADAVERPDGAALVSEPLRDLARPPQQFVLGPGRVRCLAGRCEAEVHQRVRRDLVHPRAAACLEVVEEHRRIAERHVEDQVGVDAGEPAHRCGQAPAVVFGRVQPAEMPQHPLVERLEAEADMGESELLQP